MFECVNSSTGVLHMRVMSTSTKQNVSDIAGIIPEWKKRNAEWGSLTCKGGWGSKSKVNLTCSMLYRIYDLPSFMFYLAAELTAPNK